MAKGKKPAFRIQRVPLAKIERGGGTQARVGVNEDTVAEYLEALKAGKELPPPAVFKDAEGKLWLADGFHRVEAHARNKKSLGIDVELHVGDRRAAVLWAAAANAHHGLRRTPEDKKRAVMLLLNDEEWRTWTDRAIAEHCNVSHSFVASVKESTGFASSQTRTGKDGRAINVSGIAEANRERAVEKRAATTAGTLTPDAAPAHRPKVTREYVPAHLVAVWTLLTAEAEHVDHMLAKARGAWATFQGRLLEHVRAVGTDAHLPTRENGTLDNDFGPAGRVHAMQALLRRMVPHVVCDACEGAGCGRCSKLGWLSRVDLKERERVDGKLAAVGAGE